MRHSHAGQSFQVRGGGAGSTFGCDDMTTAATEYVSVQEAARLLDLSEATVYRRVWDGSLPVLRLSEGGAIRIPRDALEAPAPRHDPEAA